MAACGVSARPPLSRPLQAEDVRPLERVRAAWQVGEAPLHAGKAWPQTQYQGRSVPTLIWTHDYTVQYFAVFDEVVDPIGRNVKRRFISVLQHEIDFRIAKLAAKGK